MKRIEHQEERSTVSEASHLFTWRRWRKVLLAGCAGFVLLIVLVMVLAPWLVNSAAIKPSIQAAVSEKTDGRLDFQRIGLSWWPRPAIELGQVSLTLPDQAGATVAALHLSPKIIPFLRGDLHLARLGLVEPQLTLNVLDTKSKQIADSPYTFVELQKNLTASIGAFGEALGGPNVQVDNGRITVKEGKQNLLEIEGLDLQAGLSLIGINSVQANLQGKFARLNLSRDSRQEAVHNLKLRGSAEIGTDRLTVKLEQLSLAKPRLTLSEDVICQVNWDNELFLDISSGRFDLNMTELYPWLITLEGVRNQLRGVRRVNGRLLFSDLTFKGAVDRPSQWQFTTSGFVKDIVAETTLYTEAIKFTSGTFKVHENQLRVEKLHAAALDTAVTATGLVEGFPDSINRIVVSLEGSLGANAFAALPESIKMPERYALRTPLELQNTRITWQQDATASFKGEITMAQGLMLTADVDYLPGQLQINQLDIKDQYSDARMVLDLGRGSRSLKFTGRLQNETLKNIFVNPQVTSGWLEGDFSVTFPHMEQVKVVTSGLLTGENLLFFPLTKNKVYIEQINFRSDGPKVQVNIPKLTWKHLVWESIKGKVSISPSAADINIAEAKLCGISTLGLVSYKGDTFSIDMSFEGKDLDVATSYNCLTEGRVKATGSYDFTSKVVSHGQITELLKGLHGPLSITFSDGVIEQDKLIARTLEILNVTEIFKGRLPNLSSTGLAYETMTLKGEFAKGPLVIEEFVMVGETLDLFGTGKIYLEEETIEGQLLAAPLKTIDTVVKFIPGINYLLGGSLIAIPIGITGSLDDPRVQILSSSAISSGLYNMVERIVKIPIRLFEKITPFKDDQQKEEFVP